MKKLNRDNLGRVLRLDLDKNKIIELYTNNNLSSNKISNLFNCSPPVIRRIIKEEGIKMKPKGFFADYSQLLKYGELIKGKTREEVYGKKKAKEWSKKVSDSLKDKKRKPLSQKHKKQISKSLKGRMPQNLPLINKNKFGKNNPMYNMTGEKNPAWRGGISFEPYDKNFNLKFKKFIKDRDGRCMLCNISFEDLKLIKKKIAVHHINYDKLLTVKENCVCLCNSCHSRTNSNRKHWIKFFQSLLSEEYGYEYGNENEILLNFSPIAK